MSINSLYFTWFCLISIIEFNHWRFARLSDITTSYITHCSYGLMVLCFSDLQSYIDLVDYCGNGNGKVEETNFRSENVYYEF